MRRTRTSFAIDRNAARSSGCSSGNSRSKLSTRNLDSRAVAGSSSIDAAPEAKAGRARPAPSATRARSRLSNTRTVPRMPALKRTSASLSSLPTAWVSSASNRASSLRAVSGCDRSCRMCARPGLSGEKCNASSHHSQRLFFARRSAATSELTPASHTGRSGSSTTRAFGSASALGSAPSARAAARNRGRSTESVALTTTRRAFACMITNNRNGDVSTKLHFAHTPSVLVARGLDARRARVTAGAAPSPPISTRDGVTRRAPRSDVHC